MKQPEVFRQAEPGAQFQIVPFRRTFIVTSVREAEAHARFLALHNREVVLPRTSINPLRNYRYRFQIEGQRIIIRGPYGRRAWTLKTTVALRPLEAGCELVISAALAGRVIVNLVIVLVVLMIASLALGFPGAPLFPLVFFAPVLLIGMLFGLHIEGNRVANLVERIVIGEEVQVR